MEGKFFRCSQTIEIVRICAMSNDKTVSRGSEIELDIQSLAFGGTGVGRYEDLVVFVKNSLPGQKIRARISKQKRRFAEAQLTEILQQSPFYTRPVCSHFGQCGGCLFQDLKYSKQCSEKRQQVGDILSRIGNLTGFELLPAAPSPDIYYYRNKMEFSFSNQRWLTPLEINRGATIDKTGVFLGLHARGFYNKVVDIRECHLMSPIVGDILATMRDLARRSGLPAYTTDTHTGFWRFVVMRQSKNNKNFMVNIIASDYNEKIAKDCQELLTGEYPQITALLFSTSKSRASVAYAEQEYVLHGSKTILERLGGFEFEISSQSFFQTNSQQTEQLYKTVLDFAGLTGSEIVFDLYCGAGSISIFIHKHLKKCVGFEATPSAVRDAIINCKRNDVENCDFVLGDLKDQLIDTRWAVSQYGKPDVVIIDPPRAGMHPKTVKSILNLQPKRIIHVSCNPATLARDLSFLCGGNYTLTKVRPIDMFPHTGHVESVAQLIRTQ